MREWTVELEDRDAVTELYLLLEADLAPEPELGPTKIIKYLVARVKDLRIDIFANEHPPPHFRVSANGETANYRIDDCSQLNGGLRRHHASIRRWHAGNQQILIDAWNRMRPSDCPRRR